MKLDRNGYAPSIIEGHDNLHCWRCGKNGGGKMDRHEIYHGPFREKSKAFGLWVHLCHRECHLDGAHKYGSAEMELKQAGQRAAMSEYGWNAEQFATEFGKSYL